MVQMWVVVRTLNFRTFQNIRHIRPTDRPPHPATVPPSHPATVPPYHPPPHPATVPSAKTSATSCHRPIRHFIRHSPTVHPSARPSHRPTFTTSVTSSSRPIRHTAPYHRLFYVTNTIKWTNSTNDNILPRCL